MVLLNRQIGDVGISLTNEIRVDISHEDKKVLSFRHDKNELRDMEQLKVEIVEYIQKHKKISLTDALDNIAAPTFQIIQAIKELERDGLLKGV